MSRESWTPFVDQQRGTPSPPSSSRGGGGGKALIVSEEQAPGSAPLEAFLSPLQANSPQLDSQPPPPPLSGMRQNERDETEESGPSSSKSKHKEKEKGYSKAAGKWFKRLTSNIPIPTAIQSTLRGTSRGSRPESVHRVVQAAESMVIAQADTEDVVARLENMEKVKSFLVSKLKECESALLSTEAERDLLEEEAREVHSRLVEAEEALEGASRELEGQREAKTQMEERAGRLEAELEEVREQLRLAQQSAAAVSSPELTSGDGMDTAGEEERKGVEASERDDAATQTDEGGSREDKPRGVGGKSGGVDACVQAAVCGKSGGVDACVQAAVCDGLLSGVETGGRTAEGDKGEESAEGVLEKDEEVKGSDEGPGIPLPSWDDAPGPFPSAVCSEGGDLQGEGGGGSGEEKGEKEKKEERDGKEGVLVEEEGEGREPRSPEGEEGGERAEGPVNTSQTRGGDKTESDWQRLSAERDEALRVSEELRERLRAAEWELEEMKKKRENAMLGRGNGGEEEEETTADLAKAGLVVSQIAAGVQDLSGHTSAGGISHGGGGTDLLPTGTDTVSGEEAKETESHSPRRFSRLPPGSFSPPADQIVSVEHRSEGEAGNVSRHSPTVGPCESPATSAPHVRGSPRFSRTRTNEGGGREAKRGPSLEELAADLGMGVGMAPGRGCPPSSEAERTAAPPLSPSAIRPPFLPPAADSGRPSLPTVESAKAFQSSSSPQNGLTEGSPVKSSRGHGMSPTAERDSAVSLVEFFGDGIGPPTLSDVGGRTSVTAGGRGGASGSPSSSSRPPPLSGSSASPARHNRHTQPQGQSPNSSSGRAAKGKGKGSGWDFSMNIQREVVGGLTSMVSQGWHAVRQGVEAFAEDVVGYEDEEEEEDGGEPWHANARGAPIPPSRVPYGGGGMFVNTDTSSSSSGPAVGGGTRSPTRMDAHTRERENGRPSPLPVPPAAHEGLQGDRVKPLNLKKKKHDKERN
uniref:Uncharacterized protein n=1 Tax=Chromera velia CCMP2878 TaxID=1169474 RepID=A0A0G4HGS8_9ALVE|eukprot:Cvel_27434.t1-p1 / transcript=Cvel_27434.t1 / gene=Cvel_27434 / organism=Chromera_velia_CCMP2878 / gene_product=hypothetical protein / transcript_product=hypothetical protein / location=Cvel_scaffold3422:7849-11810(-) / protein_length=977 / sequence_SO=supercontig / SO=protein_coding / is_pseudo=false